MELIITYADRTKFKETFVELHNLGEYVKKEIKKQIDGKESLIFTISNVKSFSSDNNCIIDVYGEHKNEDDVFVKFSDYDYLDGKA